MTDSDVCIVEYVWLDAKNNLRSKSRSVGPKFFFPENVCYNIKRYLNIDLQLAKLDSFANALQWSYDGSSTGQAHGEDSEVIIVPVYICKDAYINDKWKADNYYIAFCETFDSELKPLTNNNYAKIKHITKNAQCAGSCFGFEQEFFIMQIDPDNPTNMSSIPIGMSSGVNHQKLQQYYCGIGSENINDTARDIVGEVYHFGLLSGLTLSGMNAEVAIGQWEIQVGPVMGVAACHQLWILRYLLKRISEDYGYCISLYPKPLPDWNGSGLHTNYSDTKMRKENSYDYIIKYVEELGQHHDYAMKNYGEDNHLRMTGNCETSSYNKFSYGVANRAASVRIPRNVFLNQSGYIEDRRPASNADPYLIFGVLTPISSGDL